MKGIIWGKTTKSANQQFEIILQNYERMGIECIKCINSIIRREAIFENGDFWLAISGNEISRGHKCDVSYIDREIESRVVCEVIEPCTCGNLFSAKNYF